MFINHSSQKNTYLSLILCAITFFRVALFEVSASSNRLFTTADGLPNTLINKVVEDSEEMIWIATENGLCRFDGSQFVTYRHDPQNPNSLQSNFIRTISDDKRGHLLVATLMGVQMYRRATDDFTPIICDPSAGIEPKRNVTDLCLLSNGDFLVTGNQTYTIHFDADDDEPHAVANAFTRDYKLTYRACEDALGNLWLIRFNDGIFRLDTSGHIDEVTHDGERLRFATLTCGPDGRVYTGGLERGVYRYVADTQRFEELTSANDRFKVRSCRMQPGTRQMFLCTDGEGVKILDCTTSQISTFLFDDSQVDAEVQKVHALDVSQRGDVWMALYQRGVFVVTRNPLDFQYYGAKSLRHNSIGDRCVTSMLRAHDGNLWVATDNDGLYGLDRQGRSVAHYPISSSPGSVPSSFMNLFEDSRHRVWFGSYSQGGGTVDLQSGYCHYIPVEGSNGFTSNIYSYTEDKRGQIWVASMGRGLLRYDDDEQAFVQVPVPDCCAWECDLKYDPLTESLYVGTYDGLEVFDLKASPITCRHFIPEAVVYSVARCGNTLYSLSTNSGLVLFDIQTQQCRQYTTRDGLPSDNLFASQADGEGNLWVSSSAGLSKFNIEQETVTNYTVQDGLQEGEYYKNASMRDSDGTLWFGGTSGITWFDPRHIRRQQQHCQVRIVGLRADQNVILPNAEGRYDLSNDDHSFTVELATRPILMTLSVTYRYSIDNEPWQTLPSLMNRVSFSRLPSGTHTIRFQAVGEGIDSDIQSATIRIAYPWYLTPWAYLAYLLILMLLGWQVCHQLKARRRARRKQIEQEKQAAVNEAKVQFFINIAHEVRTPMTLVVSPLQKLMSTDKDPQRQRSYQLIDRNANRVLDLVNHLMDLRKVDQSQMQLQCQRLSPLPLLQEMCDSVTDLLTDRSLTLTLDADLPEGLEMWLDPDAFDKVIINLLSNAIKYTPKRGHIVVACRLLEADSRFAEGSLEVSVTDTGIGIPAQYRQHIFERFYQVPNSSRLSLGTGVGLNLVQALVHLHHGEIAVADNPEGQGTRFVVCLPLGDSLFADGERIDDQSAGAQQRIVLDQPSLSATDIMRSTLRQSAPLPIDASGQRHMRRLLLVDDDEEVLSYLTGELSPHYRIVACSDGLQALERLQTETFDLVLSDVMMPGLDGFELTVRIRSNVLLNSLPVILLTAQSRDEDRMRSLEVGASAFFAKPFNVDLLLKTIQNLLETHDRLRNTFSGQQLPVDQVETPELLSPDERLLQRVVKVINDNLSNPDLTSEQIAKEVGVSRVHLYRKLKELTNQSARDYIRNIRLAKAAELMSHRKMSVSEVSYQVGYTNPNNFTIAFRELYGLSPSAYMEQRLAQQADK